MEQTPNRFSDKSFLQNLGIGTIQNILSFLIQAGWRIFLRYCIFAGVLGSFWVMAIIDPSGPLVWYLIPAICLALPLAFLSDHNTVWEKVFSIILLLSMIGGIVVFLGHLYVQLGAHSGQLIFFTFIGIILSVVSGNLVFRKRGRRGMERRGGVIRVLWAIGVLYLPILLLTIFYYRLWHNKHLESSASILFCVLAFVICLTLALIRIFWMDAIRNYRAMRVGEYPSEDSVNLLELLIPRSMFLVVMVPCLMISEAVMFSVVYRVTQSSEVEQTQRSPARQAPTASQKATSSKPKDRASSPTTKNSSSTPAKVRDKAAVGQTQTQPATKVPEKQAKKGNGYRFLAWLNFSFRPYVFPKNADGTEVTAPAWIKPFGRILLSLIILLLFTHQLNIWTQFKNCYLSLYNLTRNGAGDPDAPPELEQQWREVELYIQALLRNYGGFWRVVMMYAMTSPNDGLLWKWFVDPGTAFLETVDRIYRYCKYRWDAAIVGGFTLLTLITLPFALVYEVYSAYFLCAFPSLIVSAALFISHEWYNPHPPRIRSWLLPWLYPSHILLSLIYFFVALSVHNVNHVSLQTLFVLNIAIIVIYPVLYWFSGERMMGPDEKEIRKTEWKNSRQVRLAFLRQFFYIEHRRWVLDALTYRIHPGRSRVMSARYMGPSIQLGFFKWLRARIERLEDTRALVFGSFGLSLVVNAGYFVVLFFLTLIIVSYNTTKEVGTIFSQVGLTTLAAVTPLLVLALTSYLCEFWKKKKIYAYPISTKRLFWSLAALTLAPALTIPWVYQTNGWLQTLFLVSISWLCFYPWLSYFSWRHLSNSLASDSNEDDPESKKKKASRLNLWIEALHRQESNALGRVYNRVHTWGRTDHYTRNALCKGLVEVLVSTQQALRSEKWFREEARELDRVTHLWLGEGSIIVPEELTNPAEELSWLYIQALDVLGSVLHDQFNLERRGMLAPYEPPDTKLVFECLERVLRLSKPTLFERDERGAPPYALLEMQSTLGDLESLLEEYIVESFRPDPNSNLDPELCQEYRSEIFRLLRLLDPDYDEEWLRSQIPKHDDGEEFDGREDWYNEPATSLVSTVWERTERLLRLPTPLAQRYKEVHTLRQAKDRLYANQDELYVPPMQLHREQANHRLLSYRRHHVLNQAMNKHRHALWKAQRRLYQELLAYILTGLKTHLKFEPENGEWLNLHWQTPEEQEVTYYWLSEGSDFSPEMTFWIDLYKKVYDASLSQLFRSYSVTVEEQDVALETLESLLLSVCDDLSYNAPLTLFLQVQIPRLDQEKLPVTVQVLFQGEHPSIAFVENSEEEYESSPILQNDAMLWTGKISRDFLQLEYWIAQWLLELLWQASRSWEMWVPKDATEDPMSYRQENLDEFKAVLRNLGSLLPVPARQEQEVIDNYFQRIDRRIELLEANLHKPVDETPLETGYCFASALQTVKDRLQEMALLGEMRMAQLLHAGLLPQTNFQYLSEVIFTNGETLLRYQDSDGSHDTIRPLVSETNDNDVTSAQPRWLQAHSSMQSISQESIDSNPPEAWDVEEPVPHDTPPTATLHNA
ncbi:MAG: hypothetical protein EP343_22955 [Deltaproteobacteria bacterium]|nr:MAG: hypothetical protein EP343_22955 [Deltaproteobacteria bacterium]